MTVSCKQTLGPSFLKFVVYASALLVEGSLYFGSTHRVDFVSAGSTRFMGI